MEIFKYIKVEMGIALVSQLQQQSIHDEAWLISIAPHLYPQLFWSKYQDFCLSLVYLERLQSEIWLTGWSREVREVAALVVIKSLPLFIVFSDSFYFFRTYSISVW